MKGTRPMFKKEITEDLHSKRSLVIKFLIPIFLALPLTLSVIPIDVRAGIFALSVMFVGVMGSSVGLVKMKEGGMMERLRSSTPHRRLLAEYLIANSVMDLFQFIVPTLIVLTLSAFDPAGTILVILALSAADHYRQIPWESYRPL